MGKTDSSHLFYDEFSDSFIEKITPYPHDKLHIEILNTADLEPPLPWEKGLTNEDSKKRQIESARRDGKINALFQCLHHMCRQKYQRRFSKSVLGESQ